MNSQNVMESLSSTFCWFLAFSCSIDVTLRLVPHGGMVGLKKYLRKTGHILFNLLKRFKKYLHNNHGSAHAMSVELQ